MPVDAPPPILQVPANPALEQLSRGLVVRGNQQLLQPVNDRLSREGWLCSFEADTDGSTILVVSSYGKTLPQMSDLNRRFATKEFGAVQTELRIASDSSSKN